MTVSVEKGLDLLDILQVMMVVIQGKRVKRGVVVSNELFQMLQGETIGVGLGLWVRVGMEMEMKKGILHGAGEAHELQIQRHVI